MAIQRVSIYRPIRADSLPFLSSDPGFYERALSAVARAILRDVGIRATAQMAFADMQARLLAADYLVVCHTGAWDKVSRYPFLIPFIDGQRVFLCPHKYLGKISHKFFKVLTEHL